MRLCSSVGSSGRPRYHLLLGRGRSRVAGAHVGPKYLGRWVLRDQGKVGLYGRLPGGRDGLQSWGRGGGGKYNRKSHVRYD